MPAPLVYIVHLRRPKMSDPNERRTDPLFEFGSFGCTGCHSDNLMHPKRLEQLRGARLAFAQGGPLGFRLVYLTPPLNPRAFEDRVEARWSPAEMPFRYANAPVLVRNSPPERLPDHQEDCRRHAARLHRGWLLKLVPQPCDSPARSCRSRTR